MPSRVDADFLKVRKSGAVCLRGRRRVAEHTSGERYLRARQWCSRREGSKQFGGSPPCARELRLHKGGSSRIWPNGEEDDSVRL